MSDLTRCMPFASNEKFNRKSVTTGVLVLALVVGVTSTTALALLQVPDQPAPESAPRKAAKPESPASQSPLPPIQKVNVLCVDAGGKPVSGAEVHLFQFAGGEGGRYLNSGTFTTDEQGRAICAEEISSNELGNFDRWIYARVPGRLVGVARCAKWTNRQVINPEGRVMIQASRSIEGLVTVRGL
jgi:hypothetical protein